MIKFETDNPAIEALFGKFLEGAFASIKTPVVLPTLSKVDKPETLDTQINQMPIIHPGIQTNLFPGPKLPAGSILSVEPSVETEHLHKTKRQSKKRRDAVCEDGFPESWKKKVSELISARKAFFLRDVTGNKPYSPGYAVKLKNWLNENDKVVIERLSHVMGHPYFFIPTWDENGVTQFAKNAITHRSRMVMVAKGELDKSSLHKDEIATLKKVGVKV